MSTRDPRFDEFLRESEMQPRSLTSSLLLGTILLFVLLAGVWAAWTEIDEVTRGQGKVVPSRQLQVVQSFEGGVIRDIHIRQGQTVQAGDVLLVLEGGLLEGGYLEQRQQYLALQARIERLQSEVTQQPLHFSDTMLQEIPRIAAAERELHEGRQQELQSELRILDRQLAQRRQELAEQQVGLRTARNGIRLTESEIAIIQPLVERGLEPEISSLQLQRTLNELQGERDRAEQALERLREAIAEIDDRRTALQDSFRAQALADLSTTLARLGELEQSLPARAEQVARTQVRAPMDGIVNRVHVTTIGGVAGPGEPLVEIVPSDDSLRIEAHIRPADIAFLHPGQAVKIKITAYDFARYGGLDGTLDVIGADAVELPGMEERMYPVLVSTEGHLLDAAGIPLEILPGMIAEVDILSRKRTVLNYLVDPVRKVRDSAFRD